MEAEETNFNDLFDNDDFVIITPSHPPVETTCVSCRKTVTVNPIPFGGGYIATCPECDKLAMNSTRKEVRKMKRV